MPKPFFFTICKHSMLTTNLPVKDINIAFTEDYEYIQISPGNSFRQYRDRRRYFSRKLTNALIKHGIPLPAFYIFDHQTEDNWVLKLVKGGA
jgi:hypothetical protein